MPNSIPRIYPRTTCKRIVDLTRGVLDWSQSRIIRIASVLPRHV